MTPPLIAFAISILLLAILLFCLFAERFLESKEITK